jgi:hypothetical protein
LALGVLEEKPKSIIPLDNNEDESKTDLTSKDELIISTANEHKKKELLEAQQNDLAILNIMKAFYSHSDSEDDGTDDEKENSESSEDSSNGEE